MNDGRPDGSNDPFDFNDPFGSGESSKPAAGAPEPAAGAPEPAAGAESGGEARGESSGTGERREENPGEKGGEGPRPFDSGEGNSEGIDQGKEVGRVGDGLSAAAPGVGAFEIGDAPPSPKPAPPVAPAAPASDPQKPRRGRPPGSKNKSSATSSNSTKPAAGAAWFGDPLPEHEAEAAAKAITTLVNMPLKLAAHYKQEPAFALTPQEMAEMHDAWKQYMMIRGDILAGFAPELMLAMGVGMPLYLRYVMWEDPAAAEKIKADMREAHRIAEEQSKKAAA